MAAKEEEEEASHVAPITVSPEKRTGENGWMETPADRKEEEEDDRPREREREVLNTFVECRIGLLSGGGERRNSTRAKPTGCLSLSPSSCHVGGEGKALTHEWQKMVKEGERKKDSRK